MFVLGFKFRPFAFETIAVLNPRDIGAARGARKGLTSAVWLLKDRELLIVQEKQLKRNKVLTAEEKGNLNKKWDAFWNEVVVNVGNLPMALHWLQSFTQVQCYFDWLDFIGRWNMDCLKMGWVVLHSIPHEWTYRLSQIWIDVLGLIAGIASFRGGWRATALPNPEPAIELPVAPATELPASAGFEVSDEPALAT